MGVACTAAGADAGGGTQEDTAAGSIDYVLACWRRLPPAERKRCLALIALEARSAGGEKGADKELWSEAVHEALVSAIGPSDGAGHGVQVVRQLMGAPGPWGPVADFLEAAKLTGLPQAERYAAMRLLAKLLVARCRRVATRADIPLTPKLLASNAQHVAGIFDNAFPGYLAGGLVRVVVRQVAGGALRGNAGADE